MEEEKSQKTLNLLEALCQKISSLENSLVRKLEKSTEVK